MGRVAEAFLLTGMMMTWMDGSRDYIAMGLENARHVADIDVVNSRAYPWDYGNPRDVSGCAHRHRATVAAARTGRRVLSMRAPVINHAPAGVHAHARDYTRARTTARGRRPHTTQRS